MGQLFILHRSSVFGWVFTVIFADFVTFKTVHSFVYYYVRKFTCELVTEEHLEIIESLIETHPFKNVISDNISKSVFEDTRYKSFIFFCDNKPIGYCVIRYLLIQIVFVFKPYFNIIIIISIYIYISRTKIPEASFYHDWLSTLLIKAQLVCCTLFDSACVRRVTFYWFQICRRVRRYPNNTR